MSRNRSRTLAVVTTGAVVFGLAAFGVAQAQAAEREKVDAVTCGSDCTNFQYLENGHRDYFAAPVAVTAEGVSCPGKSPTTPNATQGYSVTKEWSWSVGGGADAAFLSVIGASVSGSYGKSVAVSAQSGHEFSAQIPAGEIGRIVFEAHMYHSDGVMNWTEQFFDEQHTTADFTADVTSETPITLANGLADGRFRPDSRPMTAEELASECQ